MDEVDMVFVGADGVVESGGVINMMGTYQIALVAHGMNKPVYVAAESYKVYLQFAALDFMLACTHRFRKVALIRNLCVMSCLLCFSAVCSSLPSWPKGFSPCFTAYWFRCTYSFEGWGWKVRAGLHPSSIPDSAFHRFRCSYSICCQWWADPAILIVIHVYLYLLFLVFFTNLGFNSRSCILHETILWQALSINLGWLFVLGHCVSVARNLFLLWLNFEA